MSKLKELKAFTRVFKAHMGALTHELKEITKKRVKTAEEAKKRLRETASVMDMYDIFESLHAKSLGMSSSEYTEYPSYDKDKKIKVVQFNAQKADFIPDEELLKVFNAVDGIDKITYDTIFCITNRIGDRQYFALLNEGNNGWGDFVDDDMKDVIKILDTLKEKGATWRSVTDLSNDIPDDLSSWVITWRMG